MNSVFPTPRYRSANTSRSFKLVLSRSSKNKSRTTASPDLFRLRSFLFRVGAVSAIFLHGLFAANGQTATPGPNQEKVVLSFPNGTQLQNADFRFESQPGNTNRLFSPQGGEIDPSFRPFADISRGTIRTTAQQPDGKIVFAGLFRTARGQRYAGVGRLNADLSLDPGFTPSVNAPVNAIAVQPDGKILIGGSFTAVNGVQCPAVARLNADGSLDAGFSAGIATGNVTFAFAIQPDGKILVAGSGGFAQGGIFNIGITRLNADGTHDNGFVSGFQFFPQSSTQTTIQTIALQADGKVLAGGVIVTGVNGTSPIITGLMRLNSSGSIDAGFTPGTVVGTPLKILVQADNKIVMGGSFITINGVQHRFVARLNADGTYDSSLDPSAAIMNSVQTLAMDATGKILVGSLFTGGVVVKRLDSTGALDAVFTPTLPVTGSIFDVNVLPSGKVLVSGSFGSAGDAVNTSVLFNSDGSQDASFSLNTTGLASIRAIAVQPDGKILIGGTFNRINGVGKNRIARLNPDGSIDTSFNYPNGAPMVSAIALQPDGKILVGGVAVVSTRPLARLNQDGSLDGSFSPALLPSSMLPNSIAVQSDGQILVACTSTLPFPQLVPGMLARLASDGTAGTTLQTFALPFESVVPLSNGQMLVGGPFGVGYVNSGTGERDLYYGVLRLNSDGSHDRNFRPPFVSGDSGSPFSIVHSLAVQNDGKIVVGGDFFFNTAIGATAFGTSRLNSDGTLDGTFTNLAITSSTDIPGVANVALLPGGKIAVGGFFNSLGGVPESNFARLSGDGTIDTTLASGTDGPIAAVAPGANGKILIGGSFNTVNGIEQTALARLQEHAVVVHHVRADFDGDGRSDVSVQRPGDGSWFAIRSSDGGTFTDSWGNTGDVTTPGDFDGDGKTDLAVYRASSGQWFVLRSSDSAVTIANWGNPGDVPEIGDFDGDGKTDITVYRPSTGVWYGLRSSDGGVSISGWGNAGDVPVPADYDGDGKTDVAVYRPSTGVWYSLRTSDGGVSITAWGQPGDKPVEADYDGDGKDDFGVYRPSDNNWYILNSAGGVTIANWGNSTDVPIPGDYDGDGKADIAVFRTGNWYILKSTGGVTISALGTTGDVAIPARYIP